MDDTIFFSELDKIQKKADDAAQKDTQQTEPEHTNGQETAELIVLLERIGRDAQRALALLRSGATPPPFSRPAFSSQPPFHTNAGTVIEGVFDGTGMLGTDGKRYTMAPNYASKSKLVEGDAMKLTITLEGSFMYKQVRPIERARVVGTLAFDSLSRQYSVAAEGRSWKVLTASVTYYKGIAGDETVILIPKEDTSAWGAVEHIIKKY